MTSLTPDQIARKNQLLLLMQTRQLPITEAEELKELLEKEKEHATSLGDAIAALAVAFLIALVISYILGDDK